MRTRQDGGKDFPGSRQVFLSNDKQTNALNLTGVSRRYIMDRRPNSVGKKWQGPFGKLAKFATAIHNVSSENAGLVEDVGLFIV